MSRYAHFLPAPHPNIQHLDHLRYFAVQFGGGVAPLEKTFSPEFRNRLDGIIQFNPLPTEVIRTVVDKFLVELQVQLDVQKVQLEVSEDARDWLLENGYDKNMGARPMQRLIQDTIKTVLAEEILFGKLSKAGGVASVTLVNGKINVKLTENPNKKEKVKH